ncbi:MAG: TldD/PmbA family protein [Thermoplasmata archaeon]
MKDLMRGVMEEFQADYLEMRYHARMMTRIRIAAGSLEDANSTDYRGVGIRALVDGAWGFSSTSKLDRPSLRQAVEDALKGARVAARDKAEKVESLAEGRMARGTFRIQEREPLEDRSLEEKMELVSDVEKGARDHAQEVKSALCFYREMIDEKVIINSDGAEAEIRESRPDFYVMAVASSNGDMVSALESEGVAGGWRELFHRRSPDEMAERAAKRAVTLLKAPFPKGERATVILDPALVGLISHEAFGHTVEADFVLSGSAAQGKLGEQVASELVTLVDSGLPDRDGSPAGTLMVDDEGVVTRKATIIGRGILESYLFDRETAARFGSEPTGNARAFEYSDEPLIRMRNTYIEPGEWTLEEMLKDMGEGYLLLGSGPGQADSSAEFMFGVQEAYKVEKGEVGQLLRGVTISGNAFDVLSSVDAVGRDFAFDMGAGFCGKYQYAKVDGGGGHLRCEAIIGGRQEG